MPNKYRALDEDEDHFTVWMPVWADDVSGTRSKQYQKHVIIYMCNVSLPGKLVQQEYDGYDAMYHIGKPCSATETQKNILEQLRLASRCKTTGMEERPV
ncbi:hypothetical protein VKT23_017875 [Stygiomarasmius scandens]|uniref:Uncharacterized protein n=1 Tax=Marasmiellus scandens TaxID=2682957 RepID=A0ABR1IT60_9AGAR